MAFPASRDLPTPADARALWRVCEPIHALTYVAPQARDALRAVGLRSFWTGYIAARLAPVGAVGPEVGASLLHDVSPGLVARALPSAWSVASPATVLAARVEALPAAVAPYLADPGDPALAGVAEQLAHAVAEVAADGRPLFAAHRALSWPDSPAARLWHAATAFREHRAGGSVAATTAAGLSALEALVLANAVRSGDPTVVTDDLGWGAAAWLAAVEELAHRGLVDRSGAATAVGREQHDTLQALADDASARALGTLRRSEVAHLTATLAPVAQRIAATGLVPFPNPVRFPHP